MHGACTKRLYFHFWLICRSRSLKITDVGTNRKPVCDFLLVIDTDILSRTVSKLSQIIVQILITLRFKPLYLVATYTVHRRLIGSTVAYRRGVSGVRIPICNPHFSSGAAVTITLCKYVLLVPSSHKLRVSTQIVKLYL